MSRAELLVAVPLLGAALLVTAPTSPPRPPLAAGTAAALGAAVGCALFAALARRRPGRLRLRAGLALALGGAGEEAVWRGFALARLAPLLGLAAAVALSTAGFAASHFPAQRRRGVLVQLGTGLVFGTLFALTGSLVAAVCAHGVYNALAVAAPASAAVRVRGAEKRFGAVRALRGVDLDVGEGEIVALLGPNGAGKTTLASLLLGLRRPDAGEVRVLGADPRSRAARLVTGATPQEMSFPPTLRVREIVDFVRAHYPAPHPTAELLERFGLLELERRQAGGISGGQRRRLAVALAFAPRPRLAVLDEPTTGLDVESRRVVWDALRAFAASGGAVLLTTHYLEEAEALATRIVVLAHGAVAGEGAPAALGRPTLESAYLRLTRERT